MRDDPSEIGGEEMKRRLFNVLSGASLVLCVATIGIWVRSYSISDVVTCEEPGRDSPWVIHVLWASRGRVAFGNDFVGVHSWDVNDGGPTTSRYWMFEQMPAEPLRPHDEPISILGWLGFFYEQGQAHGENWVVPIWFITLLTAVPSLIRVRHRLTQNPAGHCICCGYDLRATPDRCPECGEVPEKVNG